MTQKFSVAVIAATVALSGCASLQSPFGPTAGGSTSEAGAPVPKPITERRDSIVATGYAAIAVQSHSSAPQQRLLAIRAAKIDAYRSLAEQVYGLYLDVNTTVADLIVTNDSFRARVEGVIYGATLTSITPVNNDTYEVTLTLDGAAVNDLRHLYLAQLTHKRR